MPGRNNKRLRHLSQQNRAAAAERRRVAQHAEQKIRPPFHQHLPVCARVIAAKFKAGGVMLVIERRDRGSQQRERKGGVDVGVSGIFPA